MQAVHQASAVLGELGLKAAPQLDPRELVLYRSEDQGMTWQRVTKGLPEHEPAGCFSIGNDPEDPDLRRRESLRKVVQLEGPVRITTFGEAA